MASTVSSLMNGILRNTLVKGNIKQLPLVQSVRFRKPRWLPIAKSKEFYVREPTPIVPEEAEELYMRYSKYRADVASLRQFLKQELIEKGMDVTEQQGENDAEDLKMMESQVNEWNSQIASARLERQAQDAEAEQARLRRVMQKLQEERLQRAVEAEKKLEKNKAANFITPESLDEAIEVMLDSRSDYNYAVTNAGGLIPGEYPDRQDNKAPPRTKMSDVP